MGLRRSPSDRIPTNSASTDPIAVVRPYQHKAGSWSLTLPKDIVVQEGLEVPFKKGSRVAVYFDRKRRQVVYQLPKGYSSTD